jgi:hypothetical protein
MLRKGYRLRVSENRVLRRTYRPEKDEILGDFIMRRFIACTPHHTLFE